MAESIKRLGALASTGVIGTADTLYTCPASTSTVVSSLTVCNRSSTAATYSLGVSGSASFSNAGQIVYQASIAGNDTIGLTFGLTLDQVNKYLLCAGSGSTVSFSAFGSEIA